MKRPSCVYVLESVNEPARHYTGITSNAGARLQSHNAGLCRHTAKHRPWWLLVAIEFTDTDTAIRFEKYLKSGSGRAFARRHFAPGESLPRSAV
jgi:putative endonuclease